MSLTFYHILYIIIYLYSILLYIRDSLKSTHVRERERDLKDNGVAQPPRRQAVSRGNVFDMSGRKGRKRGEEGGKGYGRMASNGYSRINPSIMSSASEFPQCGERLEIIKRSAGRRRGDKGGPPTGRRVGGQRNGGTRGRATGGREGEGDRGAEREVSAPARVIVRGNKI